MTPKIRPLMLAAMLFAKTFASPVAAEAAPTADAASSFTPQTMYQILLGEIALQRGQYGLAARALTEATRQTRHAALARRATEIALFAKEYAVGIEAARYWSELDPQSLRARQLLASLLVASGKLAEAKPKLAELLNQSDSNRADAFSQLSRVLAAHKDKEESFQLVRELAEPYPDLAEAQLAIAQAGLAAGLGTLQMAEFSLAAAERALAQRPDWDAAVQLKGQILGKTSPKDGVAYLEAQVAERPKLRPLRAVLAQLLVEQKRYREAREHLNRLADDDPANQELRIAAARLSVQLGEHAEAERLLETALREEPRDADQLRILLGQLAEERKQWPTAIERYRGVTHGEHFFDARLKLATVLARAGKGDEAGAVLDAIKPEGEAQQVQITQARAQILRDAERHREAFELLSKALTDKPDSPELLYDTAMAAERVGELALLEKHLRRLIELKPENAHAYNALGYTLVDRTSRVEEGRKFIQRALDLSPDDPFILDSMGWALYRSGDFAQSITVLRRAYQERPDAEIAAHLGEVLWAKGERDEAKRVWDAQLKNTPGNSLLLETMRRLMP
ncbi:MAG: tetratricopeptide repeat protein [Betaproteobacteria bacterium]|nr:tetratricopeptide repeat protein [Betaproteobacteria bacterium]